MKHPLARREFLHSALAMGCGAWLSGCGGEEDPSTPFMPTSPITRSWRMGFAPNPPRFSVDAVLQTIDRFSTRAELAIIHEDLPWEALLAGMTPDAIIDRDKQGLVDYLRSKRLALLFMLDLTNGLSRGEEATALRSAGRSLTEPAVQLLARRYAVAVERRLRPEYLGLAAETNLVRSIAAPSLYQAVRQVANDTHRDLSAANATAKRFISVQVEAAWGRLGNAGGYVGVEQDYSDFPFIDAMGLSSYPYFGFQQPEDLPSDYYTRLRGAHTQPMLVTEGGWSSASVAPVVSSPQIQARYIARHAQLLNSINAQAWLQLQYADLDLSTITLPVGSTLPLFAHIGLTDSQWNAKLALAEWDALFSRPLA